MSRAAAQAFEGGPSEPAGRPQEPVGDGRPRWMVAERSAVRRPGTGSGLQTDSSAPHSPTCVCWVCDAGLPGETLSRVLRSSRRFWASDGPETAQDWGCLDHSGLSARGPAASPRQRPAARPGVGVALDVAAGLRAGRPGLPSLLPSALDPRLARTVTRVRMDIVQLLTVLSAWELACHSALHGR